MKKRILKMTALGLVVIMSLTGCMSKTVQKDAGESNAAEDTTVAESDNTENEVTQTEATQSEEGNYVDITLWATATDGDANKMMQAFADGFAAAHDIQVDHVVMKAEDLRTTVKAAINSGEGPDVFAYEIGAGYLGVMAKSGLAYDLTDYAAENGWSDLFMDNALSSCTFDGRLYGVGNELEALGVFYNKAIFAENNLEEPETYEEFEELCRTLADLGVTPIMLDDLDQWPGYHYESLWTNAFAGCDKLNNILALKEGFDQEELADGLDHLYDIVENGWTIDSPNAMAHDDARKMFLSGQVAMYPTGTWEVSSFASKEDGLGDDCGFFFLPSPEGVETSGVFGLGGSFVVNAKADSDRIFTAIKFIEYMFNEPSSIQRWYETSFMPATTNADIDSYNISPLFLDWADAALNSPKQGNNLDVLMPAKVNEATANYIQELIAGKKTGMECMETKQAVMEEEVEDGNYEAIIK